MSQSQLNTALSFIKRSIKDSASKPLTYSAIPTGRSSSMAWITKRSAGFEIAEGGVVIKYFDSEPDDSIEPQLHAEEILRNLTSRKPFEVPAAQGVCLPDIFIKDSGRDDTRRIGVTFRLFDHPDVTIFFLDSKALSTNPPLTSRQENEFIWSGAYGFGKKIQLQGLIPYHAATLDGRKGVASLATITRLNDSIDYGYLATVQGNPKAVFDEPDLLLLVERNAQYSGDRKPVSPDELEAIAKGIATSIRRRK